MCIRDRYRTPPSTIRYLSTAHRVALRKEVRDFSTGRGEGGAKADGAVRRRMVGRCGQWLVG
eukprot:1861882-Rhodomonas_salina.1